MASPSAAGPITSSSPTDSAADPALRAVKFMPIRQPKATMNHTKAQPSDRCRPR